MKYIGSKARLAKHIVPILQEAIDKNNIGTYIEPFVGGFNIIGKIRCKKRIGADLDHIVIDLVNACVESPSLLNILPDLPSREHYYDVRDNPENYSKWYRAAILLFASYNARVYGGCYGASATIKDGGVRNYFQEAKRNFQKQLPSLQGIKTLCCDYRDLSIPNERCLIYCDPPYSKGIGYSSDFDSDAYWDWVREKIAKGHIVFASEYAAPSDFEIVWEQEVKTHLNNRDKLARVERLFVLKGGIQ